MTASAYDANDPAQVRDLLTRAYNRGHYHGTHGMDIRDHEWNRTASNKAYRLGYRDGLDNKPRRTVRKATAK
jgi:ribosome modulation factor